MKICDFTMPEIKTLLAECNFTEEEKALFLLRARDTTLETCAEMMNVSNATVHRLSAKVKRKIEKVNKT